MSESVELSSSVFSPASAEVRYLCFFWIFLNKIYFKIFKSASASANRNEKGALNQTIEILLPLSPLFDAAIDDDYLAVQSLLSKNYDVNTKVWK